MATPEILVMGLGVRERMAPGTVHRPQGADTHLFVCFLSDSFDYGPDRERPTRIPAGSIVIWRPFIPHNFGAPQQEWNHSWLLADGSVIDGGIGENGIPCGEPLEIPATHIFEKAMLDLNAEFSGHCHPSAPYARNIVQNMLIDLGRLLKAKDRQEAWVPAEYLEAKAFIEGNYRLRLTLKSLAGVVGRSPQRFATRFRELFGVSPIEHAIRLRLAEALELLKNRDLPVKAIAASTGFESLQYFSRLFRRRYGVSPSMARGHSIRRTKNSLCPADQGE